MTSRGLQNVRSYPCLGLGAGEQVSVARQVWIFAPGGGVKMKVLGGTFDAGSVSLVVTCKVLVSMVAPCVLMSCWSIRRTAYVEASI
jgi:hypothetical protein